MPEFDLTTQGKIAAIRTLRNNGGMIEVYEMVGVEWPSPDGTIYYSTLQLDDIADPAPAESPIQVRLMTDSKPDWFVPVSLDETIGDEEVELTFWDGDGVISDLINDHGEGVKVTLYYHITYGPEGDRDSLTLPIWYGHLRVEDEADISTVRVKAVQGFRSADSNIPHRAHWQECQNIFGALFTTQAEIDEHAGCPYNRHIGGATGLLNSGVPFTSCPRRTLAQCTARLGNARFHLSHQTVQSIVTNNQTSGPRLLSTSQGNETNLKEPVRVVMGTRRVYDMKVVAFRKDLNNNDPNRGWYVAYYEVGEGPVQFIRNARFSVGGVLQLASALHYAHIFGEMGQAALDPGLSSHTYSGTALIRYAFGWVDPRTIEPDEATASAIVEGLDNIRVYTDAETYTEEYTSNRVWQIARMLCDKRWGYGLDYDRLDIDSFIDAAEWAANYVRYTDSDGTQWDHVRSESHVELIERKVQQQIEDMCLGGRLSRPFLFNGKIHIVPLREATAGELAAAPVFTDEGDYPNIIWDVEDDSAKSSLRRSRRSDLDLVNRVECVFDDISQDYLEQPAPPVEDIDAQLAAGRVLGDFSKKVNPKKYSLLGVVQKAHAVKLSFGILDLGPFDEGGLQNNLRLKFRVWFIDALDLHPYKIIKVESSQITRYGFEYFRVLKIERRADLQYEIEAQAYNETYMSTFETVISPTPPTPNPGPTPPPTPPPPCVLEFGTVAFLDGVLNIDVEPC